MCNLKNTHRHTIIDPPLGGSMRVTYTHTSWTHRHHGEEDTPMLGYADARRLLLPSAVHAFIFLAIRIPPFRSLVDREVDFVY